MSRSHADKILAAQPRLFENTEGALFVVVSHDCDVAADQAFEPTVEILVLRAVEGNNKPYAHLRSPRFLDLSVDVDGEPVTYRASVHERAFVNKELLVGTVPSTVAVIDNGGRSEIGLWLARRYNRSAFPDAFNERLRTIEKKLSKLLKKDVWKDVSWLLVNTDSEELSEGKAYDIILWAVCHPEMKEDRKSMQAIEDALQELDQLLQGCKGINVIEVYLAGEDEVTLKDMRRFEVLDFEYRSLSQDPEGATGNTRLA